MDDAILGLIAVKKSKIIFQIGSQRRSGLNYHAANNYIKSGKFGKVVMVEMKWNVNQPDRWRLPSLVKEIKENRYGRNPKTSEVIYIPKKNKIRFRASNKFKEFINQ